MPLLTRLQDLADTYFSTLYALHIVIVLRYCALAYVPDSLASRMGERRIANSLFIYEPAHSDRFRSQLSSTHSTS